MLPRYYDVDCYYFRARRHAADAATMPPCRHTPPFHMLDSRFSRSLAATPSMLAATLRGYYAVDTPPSLPL